MIVADALSVGERAGDSVGTGVFVGFGVGEGAGVSVGTAVFVGLGVGTGAGVSVGTKLWVGVGPTFSRTVVKGLMSNEKAQHCTNRITKASKANPMCVLGSRSFGISVASVSRVRL